MPKKLIVYTCIAGDYDDLIPNKIRSCDIDFICFTDRKEKIANGWKTVLFDYQKVMGTSPVLINRFYKMFPWKVLPKHHFSLYVDGNIRIKKSPLPLVESAEKDGLKIYAASHRNRRKTILEEANQIKKIGKIDPSAHGILDAQIARYFMDGLPAPPDPSAIVSECGVMLRSNSSEKVKECMEIWWSEFNKGVHRDQISFPYACWKSGLARGFWPFSNALDSPYFEILKHRKDKSRFDWMSTLRNRLF